MFFIKYAILKKFRMAYFLLKLSSGIKFRKNRLLINYLIRFAVGKENS